jgi:hypothetical protein
MIRIINGAVDIIIKQKILFIFVFYGIADDYVPSSEEKKWMKSVNRTFYLRKKMKFSHVLATPHVFDNIYNYNDTVYVHLYIDFSPNWMQKLTDLMNISTPVYDSQKHYFQSKDCF